MGAVPFFILDSALILFSVYHIIRYIIDNDTDISFLILMIVGFILSVIAMIIYIVSDGGSFIPSLLLAVNGFLGALVISKRVNG